MLGRKLVDFKEERNGFIRYKVWACKHKNDIFVRANWNIYDYFNFQIGSSEELKHTATSKMTYYSLFL